MNINEYKEHRERLKNDPQYALKYRDWETKTGKRSLRLLDDSKTIPKSRRCSSTSGYE